VSRTPDHAERETKLLAPAGFRLPDLGGDGLVATAPHEWRYATVYLDTPELDVARWGSSLRHREGEGWTVKLPSRSEGDLLVRGEHVFDGAASNRQPPEDAVDLLRAYVRGRALAPSVRLRTVRRRVDLSDELGRKVAQVTDDEVSVMDGRHVASRFREVEVELVEGGSEGVLRTIVKRLHDAGGGRARGPAPPAGGRRPRDRYVGDRDRGRAACPGCLRGPADEPRRRRPPRRGSRGGASGTGGDATAAL
jgi:inorganic triphosphatase YgiF